MEAPGEVGEAPRLVQHVRRDALLPAPTSRLRHPHLVRVRVTHSSSESDEWLRGLPQHDQAVKCARLGLPLSDAGGAASRLAHAARPGRAPDCAKVAHDGPADVVAAGEAGGREGDVDAEEREVRLPPPQPTEPLPGQRGPKGPALRSPLPCWGGCSVWSVVAVRNVWAEGARPLYEPLCQGPAPLPPQATSRLHHTGFLSQTGPRRCLRVTRCAVCGGGARGGGARTWSSKTPAVRPDARPCCWRCQSSEPRPSCLPLSRPSLTPRVLPCPNPLALKPIHP